MTIYHIPNIGKANLTSSNYLAEGGQAKVYVSGGHAIKIYHDIKNAIPEQKINELSKINSDYVLKPVSIVYDSKNRNVGFAMKYISDGIPFCKLFTKTFKNKNNISNNDVIDLIKKMQETIQQVHTDGCVIADLNELNILVANSLKTPIFIDVDSYQTKSYPATAIMDNVRDRLVPFGTFNDMTDWFAFAVLAFQLYIGIHPYKGKHPNYLPSEWQKRMDDGVSVFSKGVTLPGVCNSFNVIPKRHMDWFKSVFVNNDRSIPPRLDSMAPMAIPTQIVMIKSNKGFDVEKVFTYNSRIENVYDIMGVQYIITKDKIYSNNKEIATIDKYSKTFVGHTTDMNLMWCEHNNQDATIHVANSVEVHTIKAKDIMYKNGSFYSIYNGNLNENSIRTLANGKTINTMRPCAQVSMLSSKMFDGVVYQNLVGDAMLTIPYEIGKCVNIKIPELNSCRILDMKMIKNVCVVTSEKKSHYHRFIIIFDDTFSKYTIRKIKNINYDSINFTVLPNNICALLSPNNELEIFKTNLKVNTVQNPPFDSSMKLIELGGKVHFIDEKTVYKLSMK